MIDNKIVHFIHSLLQNKQNWYIDLYAPDNDQLIDVAEKAKFNADLNLSGITETELLRAYKTWKKSEPQFSQGADPFDVFAGYVACEIGSASLSAEEKALFDDECYLTLKFL